MNNALVVINETTGVPTTTTIQIAETFGKQHGDILRALDNLECSSEFKQSNFASLTREYRGRSFRYYDVTRDGFTFLAMGFTGSKAAAFKEQYIAAFNEMEKKLSAPAFKPQTPAQVVLLLAQQLVEQEMRIMRLATS